MEPENRETPPRPSPQAGRGDGKLRGGVIGIPAFSPGKGPEQKKPHYYDVPMLQASLWKPEVPVYFFLGGVSSGSYLLARLAGRFGGDAYRDLARAGTTVAVAALIPCPVLLVTDLGDPKRFHHMLRVFKPESPMNVGTWTLTAYSAVLGITTLREWLGLSRGILSRAVGVFADLLGIPLALMMTGYTGVLISTTSTPVWSQNTWLGLLFTTGAFETGAAAIDLALELRQIRRGECGRETPSLNAIRSIKTVTRFAEAVAMGGYVGSAGSFARPVVWGKYAPHFWVGAVGAGLFVPAVLDSLPFPPYFPPLLVVRGPSPEESKTVKSAVKITSAVLALAGGLALRWAIVMAGKPSGSDPEAARESSRGGR